MRPAASDGSTRIGSGPLLVTGASGFLGRVVTRSAARHAEVVAAVHRHPGRRTRGEPLVLDLAAPGAEEEIVAARPAAIVHAAAVNPGGTEEDMEAVNVRGSAAVARAARRLGARLVHVSTDVVHDGERAPYADEAAPSPLSVYGRTKARGEAEVRRHCPEAAIVRTSLIYGVEEMDRGTAVFAARLARGEEVRLFVDQIRQPVWVESLAEALLELVRRPVAGVLNVAGEQALSRDAFGRRMLAFWGLEGEISSVRAADLGIRAPRDLRLSLDRARRELETPLPGVDEVLGRAARIRGGSSPG